MMKQNVGRTIRIIQNLYQSMILCLISLAVPLQASELTLLEVQAAVQTWVRYVTAEAKPDAVIERMEPYAIDGNIVAYMAHIEGGGFCLCGNNSLVLPVYIYSPEGKFDSENPGYQFVLSEIAERTHVLSELQRSKSTQFTSYEEEFLTREKLWQELIDGRSPIETPTAKASPEAEPDMMDLGLTSRWRQNAPYNDQCPFPISTDERTVAGCMGIATSQIMYYWKWPNNGTGTKTNIYYYRYRTDWDNESLAINPDLDLFPGQWRQRLDWTSSEGGRLWMTGIWDDSIYNSARMINLNDVDYQTALETLYNRLSSVGKPDTVNFGATSYNWSFLQDIHGAPQDTGDIEVAKLCYQTAVAVESYFGVDATGSDWWRIEGPNGGLALHLGYDGDSTYTNPRDVAIMIEEIQWLRPFGMGGGPPGHAWVVFGYKKSTSQFKMNMGWGWVADWYTLDTVPQGIVLNHNHLTHIAPAGVVRFVGGGVMGDGSPQDPYADVEEAVQNTSDDTVLIFKAGSDNTFAAATLTINKPLTLKGMNITIRKQ